MRRDWPPSPSPGADQNGAVYPVIGVVPSEQERDRDAHCASSGPRSRRGVRAYVELSPTIFEQALAAVPCGTAGEEGCP